jgi:hypothetical protein
MCVSVVDAIESENVLHVYCWVQTFFDDRLRPGRTGFSSLTKKKRTKEINKGSTVNNWTYTFFLCVSIFSSYHLAIISISSFQSLRLWYEIDTARTLSQDLDLVRHSFYHDKCVCVCVCVCHDSINTIIPYYIYTIHIYLWYDLIRSTLCVCVEFTKKIIWEKRCQGILFVEGVKFSSFDEMYTVFLDCILCSLFQKNIWRQYTVREGRIFEIRIQSVTTSPSSLEIEI